jgi:hypothetical protein
LILLDNKIQKLEKHKEYFLKKLAKCQPHQTAIYLIGLQYIEEALLEHYRALYPR